MYDLESPPVDRAIAEFKASLPFGKEDQAVVDRCVEQRVQRNKLQSDGANATVGDISVTSGFDRYDLTFRTGIFRVEHRKVELDALALCDLCA